MKQIKVMFEKDETLGGIDVIVRAAEQDGDVNELIERINTAGQNSVTAVDENRTVNIIPVKDIILLSVNDKQVSVITENDRFVAKQPLSSFVNELDKTKFVRISRYEIVNLTKVVRYEFTLGGTLRIELTGGMETWASRRCIPQIRKLLLGRSDAKC